MIVSTLAGGIVAHEISDSVLLFVTRSKTLYNPFNPSVSRTAADRKVVKKAKELLKDYDTSFYEAKKDIPIPRDTFLEGVEVVVCVVCPQCGDFVAHDRKGLLPHYSEKHKVEPPRSSKLIQRPSYVLNVGRKKTYLFLELESTQGVRSEFFDSHEFEDTEEDEFLSEVKPLLRITPTDYDRSQMCKIETEVLMGYCLRYMGRKRRFLTSNYSLFEALFKRNRTRLNLKRSTFTPYCRTTIKFISAHIKYRGLPAIKRSTTYEMFLKIVHDIFKTWIINKDNVEDSSHFFHILFLGCMRTRNELESTSTIATRLKGVAYFLRCVSFDFFFRTAVTSNLAKRVQMGSYPILQRLISLALAATYSDSRKKVIRCSDGSIELNGKKYSIKLFQQLMTGMIKEYYQHVQDHLPPPMRFVDKAHDTLKKQHVNDSFGHRDRYHSFFCDPVLQNRGEFVFRSSTRYCYRKKDKQKLLNRCFELNQMIFVLIQITVGPPYRAHELSTLAYTNTSKVRSLLFHRDTGKFSIWLNFNKANAFRGGMHNQTVKLLPLSVSRLLAHYLSIVRYVEIALVSELQVPGRFRSTELEKFVDKSISDDVDDSLDYFDTLEVDEEPAPEQEYQIDGLEEPEEPRTFGFKVEASDDLDQPEALANIRPPLSSDEVEVIEIDSESDTEMAEPDSSTPPSTPPRSTRSSPRVFSSQEASSPPSSPPSSPSEKEKAQALVETTQSKIDLLRYHLEIKVFANNRGTLSTNVATKVLQKASSKYCDGNTYNNSDLRQALCYFTMDKVVDLTDSLVRILANNAGHSTYTALTVYGVEMAVENTAIAAKKLAVSELWHEIMLANRCFGDMGSKALFPLVSTIASPPLSYFYNDTAFVRTMDREECLPYIIGQLLTNLGSQLLQLPVDLRPASVYGYPVKYESSVRSDLFTIVVVPTADQPNRITNILTYCKYLGVSGVTFHDKVTSLATVDILVVPVGKLTKSFEFFSKISGTCDSRIPRRVVIEGAEALSEAEFTTITGAFGMGLVKDGSIPYVVFSSVKQDYPLNFFATYDSATLVRADVQYIIKDNVEEAPFFKRATMKLKEMDRSAVVLWNDGRSFDELAKQTNSLTLVAEMNDQSKSDITNKFLKGEPGCLLFTNSVDAVLTLLPTCSNLYVVGGVKLGNEMQRITSYLSRGKCTITLVNSHSSTQYDKTRCLVSQMNMNCSRISLPCEKYSKTTHCSVCKGEVAEEQQGPRTPIDSVDAIVTLMGFSSSRAETEAASLFKTYLLQFDPVLLQIEMHEELCSGCGLAHVEAKHYSDMHQGVCSLRYAFGAIYLYLVGQGTDLQRFRQSFKSESHRPDYFHYLTLLRSKDLEVRKVIKHFCQQQVSSVSQVVLHLDDDTKLMDFLKRPQADMFKAMKSMPADDVLATVQFATAQLVKRFSKMDGCCVCGLWSSCDSVQRNCRLLNTTFMMVCIYYFSFDVLEDFMSLYRMDSNFPTVVHFFDWCTSCANIQTKRTHLNYFLNWYAPKYLDI